MHDLAHVSSVGSVLCRSCTTSHKGGEELDYLDHDLDHDLSEV